MNVKVGNGEPLQKAQDPNSNTVQRQTLVFIITIGKYTLSFYTLSFYTLLVVVQKSH